MARPHAAGRASRRSGSPAPTPASSSWRRRHPAAILSPTREQPAARRASSTISTTSPTARIASSAHTHPGISLTDEPELDIIVGDVSDDPAGCRLLESRCRDHRRRLRGRRGRRRLDRGRIRGADAPDDRLEADPATRQAPSPANCNDLLTRQRYVPRLVPTSPAQDDARCAWRPGRCARSSRTTSAAPRVRGSRRAALISGSRAVPGGGRMKAPKIQSTGKKIPKKNIHPCPFRSVISPSVNTRTKYKKAPPAPIPHHMVPPFAGAPMDLLLRGAVQPHRASPDQDETAKRGGESHTCGRGRPSPAAASRVTLSSTL